MGITDFRKRLALELGFFPVEIDFSEADWQLIAKHEGSCPHPTLWMRHVPAVGDSILLEIGKNHYLGIVGQRAFEPTSPEELFDKSDTELHGFHTQVFLFIRDLRRCPHPSDYPIWDEVDDANP